MACLLSPFHWGRNTTSIDEYLQIRNEGNGSGQAHDAHAHLFMLLIRRMMTPGRI